MPNHGSADNLKTGWKNELLRREFAHPGFDDIGRIAAVKMSAPWVRRLTSIFELYF